MKVVVVGGGAAGSLILPKLCQLQKQVDSLEVVLIDSKEFFEFTPGMVSVLSQPNLNAFLKEFNKTTTLYEDLFSKFKFKFIHQRVKTVTENEVFLQNSESVSFDFLIYCAGSNYPSVFKPDSFKVFKLTERREELQAFRQQIETSKDIICIGAGIVGIEMATDLKGYYPDKTITLFNSREDFPMVQEIQEALHNVFNKQNIKVFHNERVENLSNSGTVTTKHSNDHIHYDLSIMCTGIKPNSQPFQEHFPSHINSKGYIHVNQYFQLEGYNSIYCIGDVNDVQEKLYSLAHLQAIHFIKNFTQLVKQINSPMVYKTVDPPLMFSVGPKKGISYINGKVITGFDKTGTCFVTYNRQFFQWINFKPNLNMHLNDFIYKFAHPYE